MARLCTVCTHSSLEAIDHGLRTGRTLYAIAKEFKVTDGALRRHRENGHIRPGLGEGDPKTEARPPRPKPREDRPDPAPVPAPLPTAKVPEKARALTDPREQIELFKDIIYLNKYDSHATIRALSEAWGVPYERVVERAESAGRDIRLSRGSPELRRQILLIEIRDLIKRCKDGKKPDYRTALRAMEFEAKLDGVLGTFDTYDSLNASPIWRKVIGYLDREHSQAYFGLMDFLRVMLGQQQAAQRVLLDGIVVESATADAAE